MHYPNLVFKQVISVGKQVVSGIKYYITLEADDGNHYETQIWVQEWLHKKELLVFKRLLLGAFGSLGAPEDIPDAATNLEVIELARFAVNEHNKQEGKHLEFKKVLSAKSQVVAGTNYGKMARTASTKLLSGSRSGRILRG
ncbi:hypothetical protein Tsubulata_045059 [Turnera subulata]|uniref:Cysteine proteinase inhibitor n=1 Tax=Turnera subulata TaxID=218843 RepID=A0A9Q0F7R0_9ROSI|nr:hypothetical protein Tsubulata_045059 [Turnera subulata]